jgi:hypothetical protein
LKQKLNDRKTDATNFETMKYNDFKRDDTAGYGIFDELGYKFNDQLSLDVDEDDIASKFDKLMAERNQEILPDNKNSNPTVIKKNKKTSSNESWR